MPAAAAIPEPRQRQASAPSSAHSFASSWATVGFDQRVYRKPEASSRSWAEKPAASRVTKVEDMTRLGAEAPVTGSGDSPAWTAAVRRRGGGFMLNWG